MTERRARRRSSGSVTIYQVAREAGVSAATVSRVVNDRRHVRPSTRRHVEETMERLGYVANRAARGLAGGRSRVIGLLVHEVGSSYFTQIIRGIDAAAASIGYDLMLYTTHAHTEAEARHADDIDLLRQNGGKPFVMLDHSHELSGTNFVVTANRTGAREAIDHLVALGHRRIGFITGTPGVSSASERLKGYRDSLRAGIDIVYQEIQSIAYSEMDTFVA